MYVMGRINVLQFICPLGFYGAERWILALVNNSDHNSICHHLAVTEESDQQNLDILNHYPVEAGKTFKIKMSSRFDILAINKLVKIIKDNKISIIHTHGYKSDILGLLAAKISKIKCVSTPHGFGQPTDFKLKSFIWIGIKSLKLFDQIVPLSKQLYKEVVSIGIPGNKITYIKNGVDLDELDQFRNRNKLRTINDTKIIGFVGQLIPRKNVKDILDIFNIVHKQIPNIQLHLLGDGESRFELERYSHTLEADLKIKFFGFRQDRLDYMKNFDLFVMTSKDEGIPRCLMEAMAMEIPVAAYNIPGIDQLLTNDETGALAEFGQIEDLSVKWIKLLTNLEYANRLGKNARHFIDENFSARRMASEYQRLFHEVINTQVPSW
jgi:glycosyltransferase involved in cell wall biosynthesis